MPTCTHPTDRKKDTAIHWFLVLYTSNRQKEGHRYTLVSGPVHIKQRERRTPLYTGFWFCTHQTERKKDTAIHWFLVLYTSNRQKEGHRYTLVSGPVHIKQRERRTPLYTGFWSCTHPTDRKKDTAIHWLLVLYTFNR